MKDPGDYSGNHRGKGDIDVRAVNLVLPAQGLARHQVENAIGAKGSGRAVVQIEEPDGAVDDGESKGKQGVHGTDG